VGTLSTSLSARAWATRVLVAGVTLCGAVSVGVPPAEASATATPASLAAGFVHDINVSRTARGLHPLTVKTDLTAVASAWAATMAKHGSLSHNPKLGTAIKGWTGLAENVGMGQTEPQLHAAFMHSAPHRANILAPIYSQIGVGVVVIDHELYVVEDFRQPA
jgi:uncharacterized protein YkwD